MTSESNFNNHILVDFDKLLIGDSNEIYRLQKEFESNGWCFIELPDQKGQLGDKLKQVQAVLSAFFARDQANKSKYKSANSLGYSRVGHKEGIKVLIDQQGLQSYHSPLANDVEEVLKYLATLLYNLTIILKSIMFKMPIFAKRQSNETVPLSTLGMLDIVNYFNERTGLPEQPKIGLNTNEVNCVPHFDPGLFSLSILSTCDGLQLNDQMKDKWIDGPNNLICDQRYIGVIWLGEAASILTGNRFKSGIHRVVYPRVPHQPRLTIWQEICTQAQIDTLFQPDEHDTFMSDNTAIQMINQPKSVPIRARSGGETLKSLMGRVEDERGLSMSKSGRHHVRKIDDDHRTPEPVQRQTNRRTFLSPGATVTIIDQPNSVPMKVSGNGETMNDFRKRVANDRGLSMSNAAPHHFQFESPKPVAKAQDPPRKKSISLKNGFH